MNLAVRNTRNKPFTNTVYLYRQHSYLSDSFAATPGGNSGLIPYLNIMEKRAIIAVLISFVFFFGYTKAMQYFYPTYGKSDKATTQIEAPQLIEKGVNAGSLAQTPNMPTLEIADSDIAEVLETDEYVLEFSRNYGSITDVSFKDFYDYEKKDILKFIDAKDGTRGIGAVDLWVDGNLKQQPEGKWKSASGGMIIQTQYEDIQLIRNYGVANSGFANRLGLVIENTSDQAQKIQFRILAGSGIVSRNNIDRQYMEANWIGAEKVKHIKAPKLNKPKTAEIDYVAVGTKSRHFSSILQPLGIDENVGLTAYVEGYGEHDYGAYWVSSEITLAANESKKMDFVFYLGPNRLQDLEPIGLGHVVNFGKLDGICKILVGGMQLIHKGVGNYGVAIIILTLCMNVLFMPLTKTSFMSMQRMQLVQPEMMKIKAKYKNDAQKINTETMALYKKHKVNPMGGCFPMLLQMPIFISLYVGLSKSTELLGAKFLWVKDLASPDNVPLPFDLPFIGNSVHVLPLIMVVAMVMQQKISMGNMANADPNMAKQQKMMMRFMPIFFGFIFYPMPSGLVIYWLTNTVTMTAYQKFLKRQKVTSAIRRIK
ncbi:MAG: YidC/Oxa1 family membrane protein insertase [Candidatus Omnitrophota bacterium]|jgi:YidC/Oxa1 family membrane protein insertase